MAKEPPEMEIIQYIGVSDLEPMEQDTVNRLTTEHYEKIKRDMKNITSMTVHVKIHKKEGTKKKFSIHVRAISPTATLESCRSHDYELPRALHKAFNDIIEQIHHRFHADTTTQRAYE